MTHRAEPVRRSSRRGAIATFHEFVAIHLRAGITSSRNVWITDLGPANKNREKKEAKRTWDNGIQFHLHFNDSENKS